MTGANFLPEAYIQSASFGKQFDRNIRTTGFNAIPDADHITSPRGRTIQELKRLVYEDLESFAALPHERKMSYHVDPTGQRGFSPREKSGELEELREHIMMARVLPTGHPLESLQPMFYGPNIPINDVPTLVPHAEELLDCLDQLTLETFEKVETYLGLAYGTLASNLVRGQSFLRAHIYPGVDEVLKEHILNGITTVDRKMVDGVEAIDAMYQGKRLEKIMRAGPHPDMGYFTWLLGSQVGGLHIQLQDGSAMAFRTDPGSIVGNTADFISYDVEGYPSVIHWVGLNAMNALQLRLSLANFIHPRPTSYTGEKLAGVRIFERLEEIGYAFGENPEE